MALKTLKLIHRCFNYDDSFETLWRMHQNLEEYLIICKTKYVLLCEGAIVALKTDEYLFPTSFKIANLLSNLLKVITKSEKIWESVEHVKYY